jgi:glycopeptide antibiotics resistance protein
MVQGLHISIKYWLAITIPIWLLVRFVSIFIRIRKHKQILIKRELAINLFVVYIFVYLGIVLLPLEIYWVKQQYYVKPYIILVPIRNIILDFKYGMPVTLMAKNILGNIFLTIPFGVFLPMLKNKSLSSLKPLVFCGVSIFIIIEFLQYIEGIVFPSIYPRASDINDVILNTIGLLLGYFIYSNLFKSSNKISYHI